MKSHKSAERKKPKERFVIIIVIAAIADGCACECMSVLLFLPTVLLVHFHSLLLAIYITPKSYITISHIYTLTIQCATEWSFIAENRVQPNAIHTRGSEKTVNCAIAKECLEEIPA